MIVAAPLCSRTTSFPPKNREANREAEMLLAEEEDVDVVERVGVCYLNRKKQKAMVHAEKEHISWE